MGLYFLDQYSLLHFASGVVAYFLGIPLIWWFVINIIFEALENSTFGMGIVRSIPFWPGGKPYRDSNINILGDILCILLGWGVAYWLDGFIKRNFLPKAPIPPELVN
jgi:hypothetical protein